MSDDPEERQENARLAAISRLRVAALEVAREDRQNFWNELGYNVTDNDGRKQLSRIIHGFESLGIDLDTKEGRDKARKVWDYACKSCERNETQTKRLLMWGSGLAAVAGALAEFINSYRNWIGK